MKNLNSILLAALLVAIVATPGSAQVGLSAGPRLGIGFANAGGDVEDTNANFGFSFGGSFGIRLDEYFTLSLDGQYVQKGISEEEGSADIDTNLNYIEFMVPATLTIPIEGSPITPRLYVGPALAFETGCGVSIQDGGVTVDVDCDEIFEAFEGLLPDFDTKSVDFGIFFGGGADIAVGSGAISVDILYNLGLTNINDIEGLEEFSFKNRNFQIVTGYKFFFGG